MIPETILLNGEAISEKDLLDLVGNLERLLGTTITIVPQYVVYSENASALVALDAMFGIPMSEKSEPEPDLELAEILAIANRPSTWIKDETCIETVEQPIKGVIKKLGRKPKKGTIVQGFISPASLEQVPLNPLREMPKKIKIWEVHIPGVSGKTTTEIEKITIDEKNIRLSGGRFVTGTLLRHPKAGWSKVTGAKGTGQGMTSISTDEAIAILDA